MTPPIPAHERVLRRVVIADTPFMGEPCWVFTGSITSDGYGSVRIGSRSDGTMRTALAHRVVFASVFGQLSPDLIVDHLCRTRLCVNPVHLEAVTKYENTMRGVSLPALNAQKSACVNGHPFDQANTYRVRGRRSCRACNRDAVMRYQARKRAAA